MFFEIYIYDKTGADFGVNSFFFLNLFERIKNV